MVLLHVTAKQLSFIEENFSKEFQVLAQVSLDLLCVLLDYSTHYPFTMASYILTTGQQILSALQQKIGTSSPQVETHKDKKHVERVLGLCQNVGLKVKAVVLMNKKSIATNSKFSTILAQCEQFLQHLSHLSKSWQYTIQPSDNIQLSSAYMKTLHEQFDTLLALSSALHPDHDKDHGYKGSGGGNMEDDELVYHMQRLREGAL